MYTITITSTTNEWEPVCFLNVSVATLNVMLEVLYEDWHRYHFLTVEWRRMI